MSDHEEFDREQNPALTQDIWPNDGVWVTDDGRSITGEQLNVFLKGYWESDLGQAGLRRMRLGIPLFTAIMTDDREQPVKVFLGNNDVEVTDVDTTFRQTAYEIFGIIDPKD